MTVLHTKSKESACEFKHLENLLQPNYEISKIKADIYTHTHTYVK